MENELSVRENYPIIKAVERLDLAPCRLDIGKLTTKLISSVADNLEKFSESEFIEVLNKSKNVLDKPQDVVLYGFGRIGRLLAKILIDKVVKRGQTHT